MDYIWGASIVETCLCMMIELWEMRNEEVHGKEAAAIEQKRKERAAITVRALHNLEEQARPSDSKKIIKMWKQQSNEYQQQH